MMRIFSVIRACHYVEERMELLHRDLCARFWGPRSVFDALVSTITFFTDLVKTRVPVTPSVYHVPL
jgi:hypothetical protein